MPAGILRGHAALWEGSDVIFDCGAVSRGTVSFVPGDASIANQRIPSMMT
jgi:hypothetical protein